MILEFVADASEWVMVNSEYYNTEERQKVKFFGFCEDEIGINRSREQREYATVIHNMRQRNLRLAMIQFLGGIKWYLLGIKRKGKKLLAAGDKDTFLLKTDHVHESIERKGLAEIPQWHIGFSCGNMNRLLFTPDRTPNRKSKSQFYQSSIQGTSTFTGLTCRAQE